MIQFVKPKKIVNTLNPGTHFMSNAMYDAKEAMVSGSYYDKHGSLGYNSHSGHGNAHLHHHHQPPMPPMPYNRNPQLDMFARTHDSISYISPERAQATMNNMPVPVGMFMNMGNIPPRFYNQQQQAVQASKQSRRKSSGTKSSRSRGSSQNHPLTQGMSQNMSQPGFSLSQHNDLSQDFMNEYHSQMDGILSQDSSFPVSFSIIHLTLVHLPR